MAGNGYRPLIANRLSKLSAQNKIGSRSPTSLLMQEMGLEPTRYCYHRHLKPARLPIPPLLRTNIILPKSLEECKHKFKKLYEPKMSTLKSTFFRVFIVLPFCTIRSLFYCIFSLLGSAVVRLPLLPASHAPCIRCYASCFTSSLNNSPAEW